MYCQFSNLLFDHHSNNPTKAIMSNTCAVALIGSSGGGTATLGHTDSALLLRTIHHELQKIEHNADDGAGAGGVLAQALFTSCIKGFDAAKVDTDIATLYKASNNNNECHVQMVQAGVLKDVNETCSKIDKDVLAKQILEGKIQGLICISCDIRVHAATLQAAADMKIPVTGSGGTSLSAATSKFGIRLVGNAGGSVATTSYTRAVSYTHALATAWGKTYNPCNGSGQQQVPQWTSVLNACLPAFWAVALACRGIQLICPYVESDFSTRLTEHLLPLLQAHVLPTVCCVVMATSLAPHHGSTALMAAAIASVVCEKSILAGLLAGWLVTVLIGRVLYRCIVWNVPATMTNLVVAGGVGIMVALIVSPVVVHLQMLTEAIRRGVHFPMDGRFPGAGFFIGALFCCGSKVGSYHSLCLPIILIEMELGGASLWGAIDEATLVLVSAGICSANLVVPPGGSGGDDAEVKQLCRRGLRINTMFGDFIEVAYPFMEKSTVVNIGGYLASGIATELLTGNSRSVLSSAYLPVPISIWLAEDWTKISLAYAAAFGVSFLGAITSNLMNPPNNICKPTVADGKET